MEVTLDYMKMMKIKGTNKKNHEIFFDTSVELGGEESAATPMEVLLQAMGACSMMDVVSILKKKRKHIDSLTLNLKAKRADDYPKVFTDVHLIYKLSSPDAELKDLERSVELSQTKYCGASAMFQRSGCNVTWEVSLI